MEERLLREEPRAVKLTVDDFLMLADAGALAMYERTELIEGVIVEMNSTTRRHALLTTGLLRRLDEAAERLGPRIRALGGPTVRIPAHNAPMLDVVVVRLTDERYVSVETALLAVEVSISTLRADLGVKREVYAHGGVPEYWVVDGEGERVHQFWRPVDGVYAESRIVPLAGPIASATLSGLTIEGSGIV